MNNNNNKLLNSFALEFLSNKICDPLGLEPCSDLNYLDWDSTQFNLTPLSYYNFTLVKLKSVVFSLESNTSIRHFYIFNCYGECIFDSEIDIDFLNNLNNQVFSLDDTLYEWKNEMLYACKKDSEEKRYNLSSATYCMHISDNNIFPQL
jgi:hypothetical protein